MCRYRRSIDRNLPAQSSRDHRTVPALSVLPRTGDAPSCGSIQDYQTGRQSQGSSPSTLAQFVTAPGPSPCDWRDSIRLSCSRIRSASTAPRVYHPPASTSSTAWTRSRWWPCRLPSPIVRARFRRSGGQQQACPFAELFPAGQISKPEVPWECPYPWPTPGCVLLVRSPPTTP